MPCIWATTPLMTNPLTLTSCFNEHPPPHVLFLTSMWLLLFLHMHPWLQPWSSPHWSPHKLHVATKAPNTVPTMTLTTSSTNASMPPTSVMTLPNLQTQQQPNKCCLNLWNIPPPPPSSFYHHQNCFSCHLRFPVLGAINLSTNYIQETHRLLFKQPCT